MASCDSCGTTILFGGVPESGFRFCNDRCRQQGVGLLSAAAQIPEDVSDQHVKDVHQSSCAKCGGPGPIDVQTSHRVWSAILASCGSRPQVCCRSCGVKAKLKDALISGLFGWWHFPFGFVMAPGFVVANLAGLLSAPHPHEPSAKLREMVALGLTADQIQTSGPESTKS